MKFLFDFFPILLFFAAYKVYGIYAATATAIAATFLQVGVAWLRHRRCERMHLVTLAVIVVFGGATLYLRDPVFIKWKPTVAYWLFALALAASGYIGDGRTLVERMMGQVMSAPAAVWNRLNLAWALFFAALGGINLYVAYQFDEDTWVNFKLFGLMGLTLLFIIAQAVYLARHLDAEPGSGGGA